MNDLKSTEMKPEWRLFRKFSESELAQRLVSLKHRKPTIPDTEEELQTPEWNHYYSEAAVAYEHPGPPEPNGAFERARDLIKNYAFSDPRIVEATFDAKHLLEGRPMLLEIKVLGLRYLCGVRVGPVREHRDAERTSFAYRYDTLEGHIESGSEWFWLVKHHSTGEVRFRIQAAWRLGQFPNWWSRLGFEMIGRRYQRAWHRLAYLRLRKLLQAKGLPAVPRGLRLIHVGMHLPLPPVQAMAGAQAPADLPVALSESGDGVS